MGSLCGREEGGDAKGCEPPADPPFRDRACAPPPAPRGCQFAHQVEGGIRARARLWSGCSPSEGGPGAAPVRRRPAGFGADPGEEEGCCGSQRAPLGTALSLAGAEPAALRPSAKALLVNRDQQRLAAPAPRRDSPLWPPRREGERAAGAARPGARSAGRPIPGPPEPACSARDRRGRLGHTGALRTLPEGTLFEAGGGVASWSPFSASRLGAKNCLLAPPRTFWGGGGGVCFLMEKVRAEDTPPHTHTHSGSRQVTGF